MSGWSSIVLKAVDAAADAVGSIPVNGAGTAAEQIKLYGFSAEIMGAEADAVVHEVPVGVAITAVLIGVGAVATLSAVEIPLLGGAAIPVLASYFADLTLPIIGGVIARSSLIQVISGVLEVGAAGIAESIVDAPLNNFISKVDAYLQSPEKGGISGWTRDIEDDFFAYQHIESPLVLDLDGDGIEVTRPGYEGQSAAVYFDMNNDGFAERTAWITGGDGLLAIDKNSNGKIDNQTELFGNYRVSPLVDVWGTGYGDGFSALRALDTNADNKITSTDTQWLDLRVWVDTNHDGISQTEELKTLLDLNITEIDLNAATVSSEINGNPVTAHSSFTISGNTHAIDDVWFAVDPMDTQSFNVNTEFDPLVVELPNLRGTGSLTSLHSAMSVDTDLLDLVSDFVTDWAPDRLADMEDLYDDVRAILFQWAGVTDVAVDSRGNYMEDARILEFLEKFTGQQFLRFGVPGATDVVDSPGVNFYLSGLFDQTISYITNLLVAQVSVGSIFDEVPQYDFISGSVRGGILSPTALDVLATFAGTLSDTAVSGDSDRLAFWKQVVTIIASVRDQQPLTSLEISFLDDAIQTSGTYEWSDVSVTFNNLIASQLSHGSLNDDFIEGTALNDILSGQGGVDLIHGYAGNDIIYGGTAGGVLYGDEGSDNLNGSAYTDTLLGGSGDDQLNGATGDDTYVYEAGLDTVTDTGGEDLIQVAGDFTLTDLSVLRAANGEDLDLYLDNTKVMTIVGHFLADHPIEQIIFDDSTSLDLTQFTNVIGTSGNDSLSGNDVAMMSDDIIYGLAGKDTLSGGAANDVLWGGIGDDILNGGVGSDWLMGEDDDDTLSGGSGANTLEGGDGDDEYIYTSGSDVVLDSAGSNDVLRLTTLTSAQVNLGRDGNDLLVSSGGVLLLRVQNQFLSGKSIETIIFSDNSTLDLPSTQYTTSGTSGADTLFTFSSGDAWDVIYGYAGDDAISSGGGNDIVYGGADNDNINTDLGDDTVVYESGLDQLYEQGGYDTILISNSAYSASNLSVVRNASDQLEVSLGGTLAFTIASQFAQNGGFEKVKFTDNTSVDFTAIQYVTNGTSGADYLTGISYGGNINDIINGYGGNDTLLGGLGSDLLNGGLGTDRLEGEGGDDYYAIEFNAGADTISDTSGNDTIEFASAFSLANMTLVRSAANLQVKFSGTTAVTIEGQFQGASSNTVENIHFYNNDTVNLLTTAISFTGTSGNDYIDGGMGVDYLYGGNGNDSLGGYAGADRLEGGAGDDSYGGGLGNDSYYFTSGHDYIYETLGEGTDSLYLPSTWLQSGTYIWNDTTGLHIQKTGSTANDITIQSDGSATDVVSAVERIVFGDNSVLDLTTGLQLNDDNTSHTLYGSSLGDLIKANNGDDVVYAYAGNDTVYGGSGIDNVSGGEGADLVYGDAGNDLIYGENGADVVWGGANDDTLYGDAGNDTLNGEAGLDYLMGGDDNDILSGGNDADYLSGGDGADSLSGDAGNDTLDGGLGNDSLYGGTNNDTLYGDYGDDLIYGNAGINYLYGGDGADTFKFGVDSIDSNMDYIQDFSTSANDRLDIHDMLVGFDPLTSAITDFVNITDTGGNSLVKIDRDGTGGAYSMTSFVTITGITGLTDEQALLTAGHIVT